MRNDGSQPRDQRLPPRRYTALFSVLDHTHLRGPGRDQKTRLDLLDFFPFVCTGITAVSTHRVFFSMQQPVYLRDIGPVGCRRVRTR